MDLKKQFEKETGILFPDGAKCYSQEQLDHKIKHWYINYSEWLERRNTFRDVSEKPIIPFLGLWSDGKMTVFDSEDDNIDYAINAPIDKWKPAKLIKWLSLPITERGTDAEP